MLDDRDFGNLDFETRQAAEAAMEDRDRHEGRHGRLGVALESDEGMLGPSPALAAS
jgi:hypothetical protein